MDLEKIKSKSELWIMKNYPKFFLLVSNIKGDISWKEKLYLHINSVEKQICYCGNDLKFISVNKGYRKYCSVKCLSNSEETKEKRKSTCLEKYGSENPMQNKDIVDKLSNTIKDKYGVSNISKLESTKEKVRNSNFKKFGYDYISQSPEIKKVLSKRMSDRKEELIERNKELRTAYLIDKTKDLDIEFISEESSNYEFKCNICLTNFNIHKNMLNDRIRMSNTICTNCNVINSGSDAQSFIFDYIRNKYSGKIIENTRKVIDGELDIYLPDLKLAFEYNGIYWHSSGFRNEKYHITKTNNCIEKEIKLIHIWEDDFLNKRSIVLSRIDNLLGQSKKIWARKCRIKEIDNKTKKDFLEKNHLQGDVVSKYNIGLYLNEELVSLMTFGNLRRNLGYKKSEGNYELLRFCNIINHSVIGGASKLFKYFINKYNPISIISYADVSWSNGNLYEKLDFVKSHVSNPNYFYVKNGIRYNRFGFRKDVLVKDGYDIKLSETEIMKIKGYHKIYDCGSIKFIHKIKKHGI